MMGETKTRKISNSVIAAVFILSSMTGIISSNEIEYVEAAKYNPTDVQSMIDFINGTMNRYNDSLCRYDGTDGVPSDGANFTLEVTKMINTYMAIYNDTLSNYSNYPSVLDEVGDNLTLVMNMMIELNSKIIQLDTFGDSMDVAETNLWEYLDANYDRETITEDDYDNMTDELMVDEEFMPLADDFVYNNFDYRFKLDEITCNMQNITINLTDMSFSHYGKLYDLEHESMMKAVLPDNTEVKSSSKNGAKSSSSTMKLINHNHIETGAKLEKGVAQANQLNADYIRMDISWRSMYKSSGKYLWNINNGLPNKWKDEVDPLMQETDDRNMENLVTIKTNKCPGWAYQNYRNWYNLKWSGYQDEMKWWEPYKYRYPYWRGSDKEKFAALWTSWADVNEDFPGQYEYIWALLYELADGVGAPESKDYSIVGICIENEPNVYRPLRYNFNSVLIPTGLTRTVHWKWVWVWDGWHSGPRYVPEWTWETAIETYSTADMVQDEVSYIKDQITNNPGLSELSDLITVVNLHGFGKHWGNNIWKDLRQDSDLDYLGIDLYDTHFETWKDIKKDITQMWRYSKDWWLVESEGSGYPVNRGKPTVDKIKRMANRCDLYGAEVLGFYRLWGHYGGRSDYDKAYNIWTNPGLNPVAHKDKDGYEYWITVKFA
jgi:hypothetical protein